MSPRRRHHTEKEVRTYRAFKIKVVEITHKGLHCGYKIFIDNRKYPRAHGDWYSLGSEKYAVLMALVNHIDERLYR